MSKIELSLIIPTFNEEDIVEGALGTIAQAIGPDLCERTEVFIVDDGTDGLDLLMPQMAKRLPFFSIEFFRNNPRIGKGASITKGVEEARGDIVGYLDVDLSTPPRYILEAVDTLKSGVADVFIASRWIAGATVKREQFFLKDILGHMLSFFAHGFIFVGMRNYKDTQCGFKFFKNRAAKILYKDLVANDGLTDLEIMVRANLLGMNVVERGVQWTDVRESKRPLRLILAGEIVSFLRIIWKYKIFGRSQKRQLEERETR